MIKKHNLSLALCALILCAVSVLCIACSIKTDNGGTFASETFSAASSSQLGVQSFGSGDNEVNVGDIAAPGDELGASSEFTAQGMDNVSATASSTIVSAQTPVSQVNVSAESVAGETSDTVESAVSSLELQPDADGWYPPTR